MRKLAYVAGIAAVLAAVAQAQFISNAPQRRDTGKTQAVEYLYPEQVTLSAGKATSVALHFRVAPGLHINSHTPKDAFLIPTVFSIPADAGARLESVNYPPGTTITLPVDPTTKLSVYTGNFAIDTRLVAEAGNHLVKGQLHYQACDQSQCLPPKNITVAFDVIGK